MQWGFARENALARELAAGLAKELPPKALGDARKVLSVNKITRQLERTFQRAAEFQQKHRIGFIRRAVLANAFRWELREAGFPGDFIDVAIEGLVVELTKPRRSGGQHEG